MVLYSFCTLAPKTAHNTQGEAAPVQWDNCFPWPAGCAQDMAALPGLLCPICNADAFTCTFLPDSQRLFLFSSHHPRWFYRKNKYYPALFNSINYMYYKSCSQAHSPPPRLDLKPDSHFTTNSHSFTTELRFDGFKDTTCRTAFQACWHANDCWFYWCLQQLRRDYLQGFSAVPRAAANMLPRCSLGASSVDGGQWNAERRGWRGLSLSGSWWTRVTCRSYHPLSCKKSKSPAWFPGNFYLFLFGILKSDHCTKIRCEN